MAQLQTLIPFSPHDPFPLLEADSFSYEAAKNHSFEVDQWLGLPTFETVLTANIDPKKLQTWSHLDPQQFQTPYCELRGILEKLQPQQNDVIVDLGCGYGRLGFVLHRHFPWARFIGYEFDQNRVECARALIQDQKMEKIRIEQQDLTEAGFQLPDAAFFFIFDFGTIDSIRKILKDLKNLARQRSFQVVGRGRATRHLIQNENPWLSQVHDPEHTQHYSIYKS